MTPHLSASNPQNSSWVFASAGSGKTKLLTDRVLRLLLEDVSCDKILCLTFTKVAAAEMQDRINSELMKWILCDEDELKKKLKELTGKFPSADEIKKAQTLFIKIIDSESRLKVQTIHSFCQNLIKIFPFESGVKPNFEVLESEQEKLFLKQAQKEVLKKAINNSALQNLIKEINSRTYEEGLSDLISDILAKKEKLIFLKENFFGIEGVSDEIFKNFSVEKNCDEQEIFKSFFEKLDQEKILYLASELENTGLMNNGKIAAAIKFFLKNPSEKNFYSYQQAFFTQENEPRKVSKDIASNPVLSGLIDDQQKLILEFHDKFNSLKICKNTSQLLHFVDQILENYSQLKNQNAFLDYNDLIVETNRLLANPNFSDWVKMKMDGNFDHILIDESQDTNHQQWNIIKALSEDFFSGLSAAKNNRSIFIVGDEKQSIYSFQGAEPNISAEIFSYFEKKLAGQLQKIELNISFRSTKEILQAVDKVFSTAERKNAICKASEFKKHEAIRDGVGLVEIWPQIQFEKKEKAEKNYEWQIDFNSSDEKEAEVLAKIIAAKIKNWVENGRVLKAKNRPLQYGDFMILLRNRTNGFAQALTKFFHQYQIPFSSISKVKFDKNLIIQDLLSAAKFALLPHDDLNLACLLKSPIFDFSEEDLFEICLLKNKNQSSIYETFQHLEKFKETKKDLDDLIEKSRELNCFEFFYFLLEEKNSRQKIISYFGHESLELLDKFTLEVFNFYEKFSPNLQKFLDFVEKLNPEISLSCDEKNRVRITTIHSAKGLQSPVVMLPDCCYNFGQLLNAKEEISWVNFSGNIFPIWCGKKSDENQLLKKHRQEKLHEAKEEYLRLLYVAMTRAEDELYIGGFGNAKDPECWYEVVKSSLDGVVKIEEFFEVKEAGPRNKCGVTSGECGMTSGECGVTSGECGVVIPKKSSFIVTPHLLRGPPSQTHTNPAQIKGRLIHKILEIFGKNYREEKKWLEAVASKIIAQTDFLNEVEKKEVTDLTANFLHSPQFEKLFAGKIFCEVELAGEKNINRIDLLVEKENEILIVDYKSDETVPEKVPQQYVDQLKNYENLVRRIYPQKKISCAILWVKFLDLEILPSR